MNGTLLEEHSTLSDVTRPSLVQFSWHSMPRTLLARLTNNVSMVVIDL